MKSFYTACNVHSVSYERIWHFFKTGSAFSGMIKGSEDRLEEIEKKFQEIFEEKFGKETNRVASFEVLVIICQK